jgi:hypothetical protein
MKNTRRPRGHLVEGRDSQQKIRPAHSKRDVNDTRYRARLADECRRLARLTPDESAVADGFARLAGRMEGWR